jgi:hypothetical protein
MDLFSSRRGKIAGVFDLLAGDDKEDAANCADFNKRIEG